MKIAQVQMSMTADMGENLEKSLRYMREAAQNGADLVCFPEIQLTPFFPQYPADYYLGEEKSDKFNVPETAKLPEKIRGYLLGPDHPYIRKVRDACRGLEVMAAPNFYVEENGRAYDMSFLIGRDGQIIGRQKMVHIAQAPQFYEQDYYRPSEEGFQVFDTQIGRIGIVVCFDRHYPESIRTQALRGADLILVPTANTKAEPAELFRWEIKIQAFQSSVWIAMCNRVGTEGEMTFSGESIVAGPEGETAALAGDGEEIQYADIDIAMARRIRSRKPYTQLRRPELYV